MELPVVAEVEFAVKVADLLLSELALSRGLPFIPPGEPVIEFSERQLLVDIRDALHISLSPLLLHELDLCFRDLRGQTSHLVRGPELREELLHDGCCLILNEEALDSLRLELTGASHQLQEATHCEERQLIHKKLAAELRE